MKRHLVLRMGLLVLLMALPCLSCRAVLFSFTWTGTSPHSGLLFDPDNWSGNVAPPNDGSAEFVFGNVRRTYTFFYDELRAYRLSFNGHARPYYLEKYGQPVTTYIGSGGIFYNPLYATVRSTIDDAVVLTADQSWDIQKGALVITGPISGTSILTKTGIGNLVLESVHSGNWSGGLVLSQGGVVVRANMEDGALISRGLGTGPLTFDGGALIAEGSSYRYDYDYSEVLLENQIISNGLIITKNRVPLYLVTDSEGSGGIRLDADTTLQTQGAPLFIESDITESGGARRLTVNADGMVVHFGSSGWTGGTQVDKGVLIFGGEDNTPGLIGGITIGAAGYAGIGADNNPGLFISEINPTSTGTLGFDSDPEASTDTFTAAVDLTNLPGIRLGSATEAILTGTITPPDNVYRFGGGGGYLWVNSQLTGARAVTVTSLPERPLTLLLGNPGGLPLPGNSFSGGVVVQNSALVFFPGTQPATGDYTLQTGGYIGIAHSDTAARNDFLSRFPATTNAGIIGFDDMEWTEVAIALDSSRYAPGVYFGTHSDALFSGLITPATDNVYRFAAYKGGFLEVASQLTGGNAVHIGDPNSLGTFGDPAREEISTVLLSGDNNYSGATTLYTGRLIVGQSNDGAYTTALGTGALVVQPHNLVLPGQFEDDDLFPELAVEHYQTIIPNAVQLNSGLYIGEESVFTLSGNIAGTGQLIVGEDTYLTLSGDNALFSGGIYLETWAGLTIAANTATGTGPLGFGGGNSTNVYVETNAPVIHGLYSRDNSDFTSIHLDEDDTVLTVVQPAGVARFIGDIHSDSINETARFVKEGPGTLRLHGDLSFLGIHDEARDASISAEIRAGTLVVSAQNYGYDEYNEYGYNGYGYSRSLGYDQVLISGGTLALDRSTSVYNDIIAESGQLAGFGTFGSHVTVGTGVTISPGLPMDDPIGRLDFYELTLASGGTYDWNIMANPVGEGFAMVWDLIVVSQPETLYITATDADPFSIRIISLAANGQPGVIDAFAPGESYSAMILAAGSFDFEAGFDPAKFFLDVSLFQTNLGTGHDAGAFALSLSGNNLMVNFTAVPEPSTYALMALGLGIIGWTVWRRRA